MNSYFRSSLLLIGIAVAIANSNAETSVDDGTALVDWLQSKGGSFSPKAEIRRGDPNDPSSLGMFATEKIEKGETIVHIPAKCIITTSPLKVGESVVADDDGSGAWYSGEIMKRNLDGSFDILYEDGDFMKGVSPTTVERSENGKVCALTKSIWKEMNLGDSSEYLPYINFLKTQSNVQYPFTWSEEGISLLNKVLDDVQIVSYDWEVLCLDKEKDAMREESFLMAHGGWDEMMIPFLDIMQHRNGKWLNTIAAPIEAGEDILVKASTDIKAGGQIYHTRSLCANCENEKNYFGVPELLRDFGFVEKYPQRWIFNKVAFEIDEVMNENDTVSSELKVSWLHKKPKEKALKYLDMLLHKITEGGTEIQKWQHRIPKNEIDLIIEYQKSASMAMEYAVAAAKKVIDNQAYEYDELKHKENDIDYLRHGGENFKNFTVIDNMMTAYQEIEYYTYNPEPDVYDMCFSLDTTNQQCLSYRPHYHEYMVHYATRYLDSVKRVAFVGGGDSMLLYESLKYPSIELVVGLEIDQKVTRSSFKHFGAQPYFDDDRVEWWFGDAAKSLLMLPKEYFGSFDLVLVDLSETIMSITVSENLDIFDALGLLLKEDGILLKNEMYLDDFEKIWEHSALLHFYHVPMVVSQAIVLGSNKVDFLNRTPKDHEGIQNLLVKPLDETQEGFEKFHDYVQGDFHEVKHCKGEGDDDKELEEQKNSPGILMILEAEDATLAYDSSEKVQQILTDALEKEGLTVKAAIAPKKGTDGIIVTGIVLEEGYVVCRGWPSDKYFAFDIHLWSSFEKHPSVREALIEAVGSSGGKSSSSYRIVAGGMFGVSSWKDDEKNRGPRFTRDCERPEGTVREGVMSDSAVDTILQDSMALIKDDDIVVSVICGYEQDDCKSIDVMKKTQIVSKVVPIWACPGLQESHDNLKVKQSCDNAILESLLELSKEQKIRAIVIDPSGPFEMGQIIRRIFDSKINRKQILADDVMVMAPLLDGKEEWRKNLVDRFRSDIIVNEPVFLAEVVFNSSDSSIELAITSSGDVEFFQNFKEAVASIEKRSGVVSDVRRILGGQFVRPPPGDEINFTHESYDHVSALEQWNSQKPVGHQTLFQFEVQGIISLGDKVMARDKEDANMYEGKVVAMSLDGKFSIRYDDGDKDDGLERDSLYKVGDITDSDKVSADDIKQAWITMLDSSQSITVSVSDMHEFKDVGLGFLLVAFCREGTISLLWDGKIHIDLNIFTYTENVELHKDLKSVFFEQLPSLKTVLHDEQPRGFGRVVSFARDLKDPTPTWVELEKAV